MFGRLFTRIPQADRALAAPVSTVEITTPRGRRRAWWDTHLGDHAFLRVLWTNLYEIAPGVWRSNQPSAARLKRYHQMGIRTILNLRGKDDRSYYLFEHEAALQLGMTMIDIRLSPRSLQPAERYLELLDIFDRIERPFVMHCKSGADRAGLASAMWMLHIERQPVAQARRQLSLRFLHVRAARSGILGRLLDAYEADTRDMPMPLRDWLRDRYDPAALTEAWRNRSR